MNSKKFLSLGLFGVLSIFLLGTVANAQTEDNQLIDAITEKEDEALANLQDSLEFKQFDSCEDMNDILTEFLKKFDNYGYPYPMYRGDIMPMVETDFVMEESAGAAMDDAAKTAAVPVVGGGTNETIQSSSDEVSTTNLQKVGVEEPEIIKTDGKNIYYFNQQEQKIYILKSPFDISNSTINLDNAEIKTVINLPEQFYGIQLFVEENRLVILGSRYANIKDQDSIINRSQRTSLAIYNTSDLDNLKLLKFTDLDGYYRESRMIDNKLYVISEMNINRRQAWENKDEDDNPKLKSDNIAPKAIDVVNNDLEIVTPDCDKVSYIFPSDDTIEESGLYPVFTMVSVIDVEDTNKKTEMSVLLANAGQIHSSTENLYIAQNLWIYQDSSCPLGAKCLMPVYRGGEYSLIHKFAVDGFDLDYEASNLVPGTLLNQYSMDEDDDGNFRLFTQEGRRDGTNFYALDKNLELKGKIEKIAEGEQFKSSRMIGNKAYLVTFEQTDPLFVIDLADIENPEIIGELKIPGFSTYIHPLGELKNNEQYLIGLGYAANERGRQQGLQLSMYKVDYDEAETEESRCGRLEGSVFEDEYEECLTEVNAENIKVSQLASVTLGGQGSASEAMTNPRMFVMDGNNNVTLPMVLQDEIVDGERCDVYRDANGVEIKSDCYPVTKYELSFAGLKQFNFDVNTAKITEKQSIDYMPLFKDLYRDDEEDYEYYGYNAWRLYGLDMRVGFAGDVLYMVNNDFAHFYLPTNRSGKYLYFDEELVK